MLLGRVTFEELAAPPQLVRAIAARGYDTPTPVQEAVLAPAASGRDLLVSSRTGSGKTVAFGLALAQQILPPGEEKLPRAATPLGLVVAPTRELALQVAAELSWLFAETGAKVATCVGGTDMGRELRNLRDGPHLVVGTPGRLVDHLERKSLNLTALAGLVLDEADEMLDMGFRDELERILRDAPEGRRTLLFSATLPPAIDQLARRYQRDAMRIAATPPKQAHQDIEVRAHLIAQREREHAVVNTLLMADAPSAIVFCGTRDSVNHMHANLVERGFSAVALSGELTQSERTRALKALRDGRARVLVATDVAARGLDLPDVGIVIQADLPVNAEVFQHRSGRTGRAGRKGVSVLLVPGSSQRTATRLLHQAGVKASWPPVPGPGEIRQKDKERLVSEIDALARDPAEDDLAVAQLLLKDRTPEELAAALVKLRRASQPAPEEVPLSEQVREGNKSSATRKPPPGPSRTFLSGSSFEEPRPAKPYEARPPAAKTYESKAPAAKTFESKAHKPPAKVWPQAEMPRVYVASGKPAAEAPKPFEAPKAFEPPKPFEPRTPPSKPDALEAAYPKPVEYQRPPPTSPYGAPVPKGKPRPHDDLKGGGVWFRVNVGRSKKADPRWLLPLICRRGGVFKNDIGKIEIRADETRFEIAAESADRFARSIKKPDPKDPTIQIGAVKK